MSGRADLCKHCEGTLRLEGTNVERCLECGRSRRVRFSRDWRDDAACTGESADTFHPGRGVDPRPARRICATCPVRQPCLDYAVYRGESYGIWGGISAGERRRLKRDTFAIWKRCTWCGLWFVASRRNRRTRCSNRCHLEATGVAELKTGAA